MQYFYDGQIRRYIGQMIRMLSGFKYETSDGKQTVVPVLYGDMSRQVASILNDNSENKMPSAPRIAVYISNLQLDKSRLGDATHVSKVHIRERTKEYDNSVPPKFLGYAQTQGGGYTVERLMPAPYKLTIKADIWSTNTDQKLQIMEQLMMLFNPSLEIQTTDNFVDWASLSVVELTDITFSSRTIPQGIDTEIDVGTLTFETPIWISPPSKVKRLGVIHDIIMNVHDDNYTFETKEYVTVSGFDIFVYADKTTDYYIAELLDPKAALVALADSTNVDTAKALWQKYGQDINWRILLDQYGNKFQRDISQIFLTQPNGNEIVGTLLINDVDETKLYIKVDLDTYNTDTLISPINVQGKRLNDESAGTVEAIINPETYNPVSVEDGDRFIILGDIGAPKFSLNESYVTGNIVSYNGQYFESISATLIKGILPTNSTNWILKLDYQGPVAWKNADNTDFLASTNDIIEYYEGNWSIVFDSVNATEVVYIRNLRTKIQYKFKDGEWTRAFEGEYSKGQWRLVI
jgi:hypothetical protein